MQEDAAYICAHCGETIVIPLDPSAGATQTYVEDCPVCCSPNVVHVAFDRHDHASIRAEAE